MSEDEIHEEYLDGKLSADAAVEALIELGIDDDEATSMVEEWHEQFKGGRNG